MDELSLQAGHYCRCLVGIAQADLGRRAGVNDSLMSRIEDGNRGVFGETILRIA